MKPGSKGSNSVRQTSRSGISTLSKAKHASAILSTIDQLRKRKVRPDFGRICRVVQRQHKLTAEQTRTELDVLVGEKLVVKVDFKGSVSYRNAAKWRRQCRGEAPSNDRSVVTAAAASYSKRNKTGRRIIKAVKSLENSYDSFDEQEQSANRSPSSAAGVAALKENGVTLNRIKNWIREKWGAGVADSMDAVKDAATAEVNRGHLVELSDGSYALNEQVSASAVEQMQKRVPGRPKTEEKVRGISGKSVAVTESYTIVNNSRLADDLSTVSVTSAKGSSQKKFGGKRKVYQSSFSVF